MMIRIILILVLIVSGTTATYAQNRPSAPIETTKKIREARPSFMQLVQEIDELQKNLLELEIAVTEANTARLESQNANSQKNLELMEKIYSLNKPLNQLRNEFDNRGSQLLQWSRDISDAETRLTQAEAQIEEDGKLIDQQIKGQTSRLDALEARIQNISTDYVQKTDFELSKEELLTRIGYLENANQSLVQRFQASEALIQQLGEQIIDNSDRLALANKDALRHLRRVEQLEAQIVGLDSLSDRLDMLAAKDLKLDEEIFVINDIGSRLEELATDFHLFQTELLRIEGEAEKLDDISRLTAEDLSAVLSRVDELEIVQFNLDDQNSLRDRMSEFLYRQSVMAEDVDQLKLLEDKFMAIEKRLAPDENLPDAKEEIPGMQHSSETKPFLY